MFIVLEFCFFFFFKQKTAYEMRISDWSSDVCSSDLTERRGKQAAGGIPARKRSEVMNLIQTLEQEEIKRLAKNVPDFSPGDTVVVSVNVVEEIGRASCRERVCQYV